MDIFAAYEAELRHRQRAPRTIAGFRYHAACYTDWLAREGLTVDGVRRPDLQRWLAETGWSATTQRVAFAWVRAAYTLAVDDELLERNPCRRVRLPAVRQRVRTLSAQQVREMEKECRDATDLAGLLLFTLTGARACEVLALTWDDLDGDRMLLHGKGAREREIPIHPRLRRELRELPIRSPWVLSGRHGPLSYDALSERIKRLGPATCHDFRRTVATQLMENRVPERVIKALLGHAPAGVLQTHYLGVPYYELESAILTLA